MNEKVDRKVARGICFQTESVLLCKAKNKNNYFLIGGGLKQFESATTALLREIKEEPNKEATIKSFVGVVENCWTTNEITIFETNFLFMIDIPLEVYKPLKSAEENLSFEWIKLTEINSVNLQPVIMKQIILQSQNHSMFNGFWHTEFK